MRSRVTKPSKALTVGAALLATLAASANPAGAQTAQVPPSPPAHAQLPAQTLANLLAGMKGEAFANAEYKAFGAVANPSLARLFNGTANFELGHHFAAFAAAYGLSGTDAANLQDVVAGENYEATTMYPSFASRAQAVGDTKAAQLFTELAGDETTHRDAFQQALNVLTASGSIPSGPTVSSVRIVRATAPLNAQTRQDLLSAMHGEAFAHAKYLKYAQAARAHGHPALAVLFTRVAAVELNEHFASEANLEGLVGTDRANLTTAINGETNEATVVYPTAAEQAFTAGNRVISHLFMRTGHEEARHARQFTAALVQSYPCSCPYAR